MTERQMHKQQKLQQQRVKREILTRREIAVKNFAAARDELFYVDRLVDLAERQEALEKELEKKKKK